MGNNDQEPLTVDAVAAASASIIKRLMDRTIVLAGALDEIRGIVGEGEDPNESERTAKIAQALSKAEEALGMRAPQQGTPGTPGP